MRGACALMKAIGPLNCPWTSSEFEDVLGIGYGTGVVNVVKGVAPTPNSPMMKSSMMVTMTNTFHRAMVIQKSNGLDLTLFISMTMALMVLMIFVEIQT